MLGIVVCGLLITGCSGGTDGGTRKPPPQPAVDAMPLTAEALRPLLLTQRDLGSGYAQVQDDTESDKFDDISVQGCPELEKLSQNDDKDMFAAKAEASFAYDQDATLDEELHSDRPSVLSSKIRQLFTAYTSCPTFTMTSGTTPIEVTVSKAVTPQLGDEQFAYTMTIALPAGPQVLKTMSVRTNNVAVMLVGAPALVDRHIEAAVGKIPKLIVSDSD
ncbi:hypothetical protein ABT160_41400 [Streptomyces sp. NPDC001941]|uniref:hypothetical protein n=1 Tax=Streptomyces sp. NPDC001941 TaxID=3154659 RepID=UPI0033272726